MSDAADVVEETVEETSRLIKRPQSVLTYLSWALLAITFSASLLTGRWNLVFLSVAVLILTTTPFIFQSLSHIRLPRGFVGCIILFLVSTIFLGEAFDFYERFWWWDAVLHIGSAIGFAIIGMLIVIFLIRADRLATTPAFMLVFMAFSFAVSIGTIWEIFEYAMDQLFGLNMQKSGLHDTMWDLIVDVLGAGIGAFAGFAYLKWKGHGAGVLADTIEHVVKKNPDTFETES